MTAATAPPPPPGITCPCRSSQRAKIHASTCSWRRWTLAFTSHSIAGCVSVVQCEVVTESKADVAVRKHDALRRLRCADMSPVRPRCHLHANHDTKHIRPSHARRSTCSPPSDSTRNLTSLRCVTTLVGWSVPMASTCDGVGWCCWADSPCAVCAKPGDFPDVIEWRSTGFWMSSIQLFC